MLKGKLIHPDILEALGRAGHGSQILIADGNYPANTTLGKNSKLVPLNLSPGIVSCTDVLKAIVDVINIENVIVMEPDQFGPYSLAGAPEIWDEFKTILSSSGFNEKIKRISRPLFYDLASNPDVCLAILTGEERIFANLILTIGVIRK
jgi:L-fucose mutarotase